MGFYDVQGGGGGYMTLHLALGKTVNKEEEEEKKGGVKLGPPRAFSSQRTLMKACCKRTHSI